MPMRSSTTNRMSHDIAPPGDSRCGYIALAGAPNVGKSTLVNACVGSKVSIVTHKVQTTRCLVRGIVLRGSAQIVFVDTPGIFSPRRKLEKAMVTAAWGGVHDADAVAVLIDARAGFGAREAAIVAHLGSARHCTLVINKIDTVPRHRLLSLARRANAAFTFSHTFMICALNGDGLDRFLDWAGDVVPAGPWLYDRHQTVDMPARLLAAEITREQVFLRLHDELPYTIAIETTRWERSRNKTLYIEQIVAVSTQRHKQIALGRKGATIKAVSMAARHAMQEMFDCPVHLFLHVKVREKWQGDPRRYTALGLDFPEQ